MHRVLKHLFYFVTARCNAHCKFCCYWQAIQDSAGLHEELTLAEIEKVARTLGKLDTLSITGGEPFLRADIVELCALFYTNTRFRILSISSNGLITENIVPRVEGIIKACPRSFIILELPLDEVGEAYDDIRGYKGAFEKLKQTYFVLQKLQKKRKKIQIKFTVTYSSYNKDRIIPLLESARTVFGDFDYSIGLVHGEPRDKRAKKVDLEEFFNVRDKIPRYIYTSGLSNALLRVSRRIVNSEFKRRLLDRKCSITCRAIDNFAILAHNGDVYPCESLWRVKLGNVKDFDYDMAKILSSENINVHKKELPDRRQCICDWECGIARSVWSNKLFQLRMVCALVPHLLYKKY